MSEAFQSGDVPAALRSLTSLLNKLYGHKISWCVRLLSFSHVPLKDARMASIFPK